jgi:hypothetical protein
MGKHCCFEVFLEESTGASDRLVLGGRVYGGVLMDGVVVAAIVDLLGEELFVVLVDDQLAARLPGVELGEEFDVPPVPGAKDALHSLAEADGLSAFLAGSKPLDRLGYGIGELGLGSDEHVIPGYIESDAVSLVPRL